MKSAALLAVLLLTSLPAFAEETELTSQETDLTQESAAKCDYWFVQNRKLVSTDIVLRDHQYSSSIMEFDVKVGSKYILHIEREEAYGGGGAYQTLTLKLKNKKGQQVAYAYAGVGPIVEQDYLSTGYRKTLMASLEYHGRSLTVNCPLHLQTVNAAPSVE